MRRVAVIGTTTWGTTLALGLARREVPVLLWARTKEEAELLQAHGENTRFLPGHPFPPTLRVTADTVEAVRGASMVILAVPSRSMRENARVLASTSLGRRPTVVSAAKGLERLTGKRMSQVLLEELPRRMKDRLCVLSGPNLSKEIVEGKPASTVVACHDLEVAREVQGLLTSPVFRVYVNQDVVGVELGGALKNILAIGAGISDGLGYGDNAKAAFITRGLVEITRLGVAAGASPLTFAGLAGLGDVVATCSSPLSRNHYVGEQLARGRPLQEVLASMKNVAEGVDTTVAALHLAEGLGVEMPITQTTYQVLFQGLDPRQAVALLMGRAPTEEWAGLQR